MIYLLSLVWCLCLAWIYDVLGFTKNKKTWYYLLLIWFICLSGFQYMVGSDIPGYMNSYQTDYRILQFEGDVSGRHQPGWILLSYICRHISGNFVFFKFIQAIFVNVAIFSFFRRETKYLFLCITLYAITTYLIFNFNILRQSFAIGFMLYYISYLKRGNYIMAAFTLFGAYMFHNTALIGLILPLFRFLKFNWVTIVMLSCFTLFFVAFLIKLDTETILNALIDSGYLADGLQEHAEIYAGSQKFAAREVGIGLGRYVQLFMIIVTIFYYTWKKKDMYFGGIGIVYLFMQILNYSIPIMFRFRQYFDMSFYVMFSYTIIDISFSYFKQIKQLVILSCLIVFVSFPIKEYLFRYEGTPYRYIDQYYPYHSIFNPTVDHDKLIFFKIL